MNKIVKAIGWNTEKMVKANVELNLRKPETPLPT